MQILWCHDVVSEKAQWLQNANESPKPDVPNAPNASGSRRIKTASKRYPYVSKSRTSFGGKPPLHAFLLHHNPEAPSLRPSLRPSQWPSRKTPPSPSSSTLTPSMALGCNHKNDTLLPLCGRPLPQGLMARAAMLQRWERAPG